MAESFNIPYEEAYSKLLQAYKALPQVYRRKTVMEVSGNPHYENVSSNILAFYFDTAEEHGLSDCLLMAFLNAAGIKTEPLTGKLKVHREWSTEQRKRIDLILDSPSLTIGIENKIYHWLGNDLNEYGAEIDRIGQGKGTVVKAVLGLKLVKPEELVAGFVSLTYSQLWQQVRSLLGHYAANADPKWLTYLFDFMATTTNLADKNLELQKNDAFFIEHHEMIGKMMEERNAFLGRLSQRLQALSDSITDLPEAKLLVKLPWVYDSISVVLDYQFHGIYSVAFDVVLQPSGWEFQFLGRKNNENQAYARQLLQHPSMARLVNNAPVKNGRHIVQQWPVDTDIGVVRDSVVSWMRAVNDAAAGTPH